MMYGVEIPENKKLLKELISLELDAKTDKIDHPAHGSKDLSDAHAGVVYGLSTASETWVRHEVPMNVLNASVTSI